MKRDPVRIPVKDPNTDRALEDMRRTFQEARLSQPTVIRSVELADGVRVVVRHGLGRKYTAVFPSAIRGATAAGYILEEEPTDRAREIWLTANDFGATVTVDLLVHV